MHIVICDTEGMRRRRMEGYTVYKCVLRVQIYSAIELGCMGMIRSR